MMWAAEMWWEGRKDVQCERGGEVCDVHMAEALGFGRKRLAWGYDRRESRQLLEGTTFFLAKFLSSITHKYPWPVLAAST